MRVRLFIDNTRYGRYPTQPAVHDGSDHGQYAFQAWVRANPGYTGPDVFSGDHWLQDPRTLDSQIPADYFDPYKRPLPAEFTEMFSDDENEWSVETSSYGQPDVFEFTIRPRRDAFREIAHQPVFLELWDDRAGGFYENGGLVRPCWVPRRIRRLFGGTIEDIKTSRVGNEVLYHCKALGWAFSMENTLLTSTDYTRNFSDREVILGKTVGSRVFDGVCAKVRADDTALSVEESVRVTPKTIVKIYDGVPPREVLVDCADFQNIVTDREGNPGWNPQNSTYTIETIGEYADDVDVFLEQDTLSSVMNALTALSQAEWRIDPNQVLWHWRPDFDSPRSLYDISDREPYLDFKMLQAFVIEIGQGSSHQLNVDPHHSYGMYEHRDLVSVYMDADANNVPIVPEEMCPTTNATFDALERRAPGQLSFVTSHPLFSHPGDYENVYIRIRVRDCDTTPTDTPWSEAPIRIEGRLQDLWVSHGDPTRKLYTLTISGELGDLSMAGCEILFEFMVLPFGCNNTNREADYTRLRNSVSVIGGLIAALQTERARDDQFISGVTTPISFKFDEGRLVDTAPSGIEWVLQTQFQNYLGGPPAVFVAPRYANTQGDDWTHETLAQAADDPNNATVTQLVVETIESFRSNIPVPPAVGEYDAVYYNSVEPTLWFTNLTKEDSAGNVLLAQLQDHSRSMFMVGSVNISARGEASNHTSIRRNGQRPLVIYDLEIVDTAVAQKRADAELAKQLAEVEFVTTEVWQDGIEVGTLLVHHSQLHGLGSESTWMVESYVITPLSPFMRRYELRLRLVGSYAYGESISTYSDFIVPLPTRPVIVPSDYPELAPPLPGPTSEFDQSNPPPLYAPKIARLDFLTESSNVRLRFTNTNQAYGSAVAYRAFVRHHERQTWTQFAVDKVDQFGYFWGGLTNVLQSNDLYEVLVYAYASVGGATSMSATARQFVAT